MNPKILPYQSKNVERIFRSTSPELCVDGPARSGKTLAILQKIFHLHFKFPGLRSAIVRSDSVDLTDTIRYDIKDTLLRFRLDDKRSPVKYGVGGMNRFEYLYINDGEMRLGGMNRPGKVLGAEYDILFYSQAEQSTEEQHQLLKTRVAGSSGVWRNKKGEVLYQYIMDANPDSPDHYLKEREEEGLLDFVTLTFEDNPAFYWNGAWTRMGLSVTSELDRSLVGVYHDRFYKSLWVNPEGAVFGLDKGVHLIDRLPDDIGDYVFYNAMDFGMTAPSVCLWIGEHPKTKDVIVTRELRHSGLTIIELGDYVRELRKERILATVIDNDEEKQKLLLSHCRIPSQMARKGPGSIVDGIGLMQHALKNTSEGKEAGLRFYTGLREGMPTDARLLRSKEPLSVIKEMQNLSFKPKSRRTGSLADDLPVGSDHGVDPLRYWFLWREERRPAIGFSSGAATRKKRI
ncbi:MAG: hypothetical protein OXM61_16705 [Candidatus Poribacteria bacterium]|nr:hypothetical protein [Candidatus Poribacteria bacterium]